MDLFTLLLSAALAALVGWPQLAATASYMPRCVRSHSTYASKVDKGKVSLPGWFLGICRPGWRGQVDGVFYPEVCASVGILLPLVLLCEDLRLWGILGAFLALSRGGRLFRLFHKVMLRIPARWMYFVNLTLVFLGIQGAYVLTQFMPELTNLLLLLQAWFLVTLHSRLWPMSPFVQRWEKPSKAFGKWDDKLPVPQRLILPYPIRTGQIHHQKTIGYCGGSALQAMASFRRAGPNGIETNDISRMTQEELDWWMSGIPTWADLERRRYGL